MLKKILTTSIPIIITVIGVLSWHSISRSEVDYTKYIGICGQDSCCYSYNAAMDAMEEDWEENLQQLIDQEKPASDMVDDAYENLRTYECWLKYVCLAVQYSGHAPMESAEGTGLTSKHIEKVPGCVKPEDLGLGGAWNTFLSTLNLPSDLTVSNKMNYFPQCMTDKNNNNRNPSLRQATKNYQKCLESLELRFGCKEDAKEEELQNCFDQSNALAKVETVLKKNHAEQKTAALENKFRTLIPKMLVMEEQVEYMKNKLIELDLRLECYAGKCD